MLKADVLKYFGHEEGKRTGGINKLAQVMGVDNSAISQWGEHIPMKKAKKLDEFLSNERNLKVFKLSPWGRPVFDVNDYV